MPHLLGVTLHDVVDLLQLVGQPLLAAELVLLQGEDQLLVVLHSVTGKGKEFYYLFIKLEELGALRAQVLGGFKNFFVSFEYGTRLRTPLTKN